MYPNSTMSVHRNKIGLKSEFLRPSKALKVKWKQDRVMWKQDQVKWKQDQVKSKQNKVK